MVPLYLPSCPPPLKCAHHILPPPLPMFANLAPTNDHRAKRMHNLPNQDLSQNTCHLLIDPLLGARQLNVHVTINADETAFVLCLAPFETNDDFFVDTV